PLLPSPGGWGCPAAIRAGNPADRGNASSRLASVRSRRPRGGSIHSPGSERGPQVASRRHLGNMTSPTPSRILVIIVSALAMLGLLAAPSLPGQGQDPAPGGPAEMTDLLRSTPFDRITLSDGSTLIVDPVSPRPLPTIDPAKSRKHEKARARD